MKDILRLCITLGVICLVSAALLGFVEQRTREPRAAAARLSQQRKLSLILPAETAGTGDPIDLDGVEFIPARDQAGRVIAYAAKAAASGFGGEMVVLASLDPKGVVLGVVVDRHNETPGIGSQAVERRQVRSLWRTLAGRDAADPFPPNPYLDSYAGRSLAAGEFTGGTGDGGNSVRTISGATMSSRAVMRALNRIRSVWAARGQELAKRG